MRSLRGVERDVLKAAFPIVLGDRVCNFAHTLGLGSPEWAYLYEARIVKNDQGLVQHGNTSIKWFTEAVLLASEQYPQRLLIWSHFPGLLIYLALICCGLWRRDQLLLGVVAIVLINIPLYLLFSSGSHFRYLYPQLLCLPFAVAPLFRRVEEGESC